MRALPPLLAACALVLLCSCAGQAPRPQDHPWLTDTAQIPPIELTDFMRLPAADQSHRRDLAEAGLNTLRLWNPERYAGMRLDFQMDVSARDMLSITRWKKPGPEFDETVRVCRRAVELDPTHSEVWLELGRIGTVSGDWLRAAADLDTAWDALSRDPRTRGNVALEQRVILAGAWLCHDRGLWEEGLAWLSRRAGAWDSGLHQEQMLVRGLLQAGAGLFTEAYHTSLRLPPLRYRDTGMFTVGLSRQQQGYGMRWIQAMNWHHQGEPALALHALGTPASTKIHIPHMNRYWTDAALLFAHDGDVPAIRLASALSLLGRAPMLYYMPVEGFSFPPVLFDQPDVTVPFMTIEHDRFVAGALFSYACQVMADCSAAEDDSVRLRRGERALEAFSICLRRGDRPALARALRGRTRFYMGQGDAALPDLRTAHAALALEGRIDPVTSTVIGTLLMQGNSPAEAVRYLGEAVEADPELAVAWRTYGVTLARLNRHAEADAAMDRAVDLNPYAVGGWYNRGLHHLNLERFAAAQEDLLIAERIEPDNTQIKQLLATLSRRWEEADDAERLAAAGARADSVQAALAAGDALGADPRDELSVLDGRRLYDLADADFAARADSLAAAYVETAESDPVLRARLAAALLRADRAEETLELLAPLWPDDLGPAERLLVLQADRDLGRPQRARILAESLPDDAPRVPEMEFWTLAALICIDHGDRALGLKALDRAIALAPANTALTSFRRMIGSGD